MKRHPCVVAAVTKSLKQNVTCNLKKREGDVWLFRALSREKRRKVW